jgi:inner membrane protease ATP23
MVRFFRENLEKAGCGVSENFFKAVNCDKSIAGGYVRGKG